MSEVPTQKPLPRPLRPLDPPAPLRRAELLTRATRPSANLSNPGSLTLTPAELEAALNFDDPALIDEVHGHAQRLVAEEQKRWSDLEAKAGDVRTQVATGVTLVSTLAAVFWQSKASAIGVGTYRTTLLSLFGLTLFSGLASVILATLAVRVRTNRIGFKEAWLVDPGLIQDALWTQRQSWPGDPAARPTALAIYRRQIAAQFLLIRHGYLDSNASKARRTTQAQWAAFGFLLWLATDSLLFGVALLK